MKILKVLVYNTLILLSLIIILELVFGSWIFHTNSMDNLGVQRSRTYFFDISNRYANDTNIIKVSRDKFGLRGSLPNLPEKIDILTIGGSTTAQILISDGETWQEIIENKFSETGNNIIVSNAGIDGHSTVGHIKNFDLWFPYIPNLEPKIILFYIGINDFNIGSEHVIDDQNLLRYLKSHSAIYNLLRKIKGSILAHVYDAVHSKVDFSKLEYTTIPENNPDEYHNIMKERNEKYYERLIVLIDKSREFGAEPIFVTQPSRNYKISKQNVIEGATNRFQRDSLYKGNGVDYYYMSRIRDSVIFLVANKYDVKYFDLSVENNWEDDDFYDFEHLTPKGTKKVGFYLFNKLSEYMKNKE